MLNMPDLDIQHVVRFLDHVVGTRKQALSMGRLSCIYLASNTPTDATLAGCCKA